MTTSKTAAKPPKKAISLNRRNTLIGMSFILPNFLGFFIFIMIPVVFSFFLSFASWDGFNAMSFVGLDNFGKIFGDRVFKAALGQTLVYAVFTVLFSFITALGLAVLLNRKIHGINFFRSAVFFPYVASIVAVGVVWNAMFQPVGGPVNTVLEMLGVTNPPGWFTSIQWAMPATIVVSVWKNMGYFMIIYLAALQDVPPELYEAATIDGANKWEQFWRITFPMLTPSHFFVMMMLTINSFKVFDLIYVLTNSGPGTATKVLATYIYDTTFISWDYGAASAASMILFLIVGAVTVFQFRFEKKFNDFM